MSFYLFVCIALFFVLLIHHFDKACRLPTGEESREGIKALVYFVMWVWSIAEARGGK